MPADNPRPPKRSWRDAASPSQGTAQRRNWRQEAGAGGETGPFFTRRGKIVLAGGGLLAILGAIIAVYLWLRPIPPPRLILVGAGYETNLAVPHNVHGVRCLADLARWANEHNKNWGGDKEHGIDIRDKNRLTADSDAVLKGLDDCTSKTVIVYLAVHGGNDRDGAFLLPDDADPKNTSFMYRLDKVLKALQKLPEKTQKLLILDATQVPADWALHMVNNDFARALEKEPALKVVKNLVVLSASGEDQRSWVTEDFGHTVFGHFVLEGLKGAADLSEEGGDANGVISAGELAAYVKRKVEVWVRHNRGARQVPVLIDNDGIAASMELVGTDGTYKPAVPKEFTEPAGLVAAWNEYFDLDRSSPHPAVHEPHLWRQYQDTLLRYEQLLRADDADSAERLTTSLQFLRKQIAQSKEMRQHALTASLAMPAVLGVALPETVDAPLMNGVARLWQDSSEADRFAKLIDPVTDALKPAARLRVCSLLLDRAAESEASFRRACEIMPLLDDVSGTRPAEVEFALLLNHHLPRPWDFALVKNALQVRRLAELSAVGLAPGDLNRGKAAYSEQVHRWIRTDVGSGDQARVLGQDLLMATARRMDGPAKFLKDAADAYTAAQAKANPVRTALEVRDRAFMQLPWLTRWQSGQSFSAEEEQTAAELEEHKRAAWANLYKLSAALDDPGAGNVGKLADPARIANEELKVLLAAFRTQCEAPRTELQKHWLALDDLLNVPLIEPEQRVQMLLKLRSIGTSLNAHMDEKSNAGGLSETDNARFVREAALRQSRLAMATLNLEQPKKPDESAWWRATTEIGDRAGDELRRLAEETALDVTAGRKAAPTAAAAQLMRAAGHARLLGGAAVRSWLNVAEPNLDPVDEYRRVQMHDLLVFQAERAWNDYTALYRPVTEKDGKPWDDPAKPYFSVVGNRFLDTAADLVTNNRPDLDKAEHETRLKQITAERRKLAAPDLFAIKWRDGKTWSGERVTLHLTDEDALARDFLLVGAAEAPPGYPVMWERPGKYLRTAENGDRVAFDRLDGSERTRTFEIRPDRSREPALARETSEYVVAGFYRGRRIESVLPVVLHHRPDVVSIQPGMPEGARLSVQIDRPLYNRFAAGNCHLVIVLDCSGSMVAKKDGKTRLNRALEALKRTVRRLPAGVTLSLYTFSAEEDKSLGNEPRRRWNQEKWTGEDDDLDKLMEKVRVTPYGETPLVYCIYRAWEQSLKEDRDAGAKAMLVVTDGADEVEGNISHYAKNAERFHMEGETVTEFLGRTLGKGQISFNVIGFELTDEEREKMGYKEFDKAVKAIGGRIHSAGDNQELESALARSLLQARFRVQALSGRLKPGSIPDEGIDIGILGNNERWISGLSAGDYNVALQTSLRRVGLDQTVSVADGDALVLNLTEFRGKYHFIRPLYLDAINRQGKVIKREQPEGTRPRDGGATGWHLGVVQNQNKQTPLTREGLQMMVTIEKDLGPQNPKDALRVARPRWTFFEVAADRDGATVPGLRFHPLSGYPAPAWSLDYFDDRFDEKIWPARTKPVLRAYWTEEGKVELRFTPVDRGVHFKSLIDLRNKPVDVAVTETEPGQVVIESVTQEKLDVKPPRGDERKRVDCLVVRLRYKDGKKPFFVQLPDEVKPSGEEHRFYTEAGKYTGIFWDVSAETAEKLAALKLVSLEQAKRSAAYRATLELPAPGSDGPPDPPR